MTGNETVKFLKSKYQERKHYAHIAIIVKKSTVEVWHPVPVMVEELKSLGFEEQGFCCRKSWEAPKLVWQQEGENAWEQTLRESAAKRAKINFNCDPLDDPRWGLMDVPSGDE